MEDEKKKSTEYIIIIITGVTNRASACGNRRYEGVAAAPHDSFSMVYVPWWLQANWRTVVPSENEVLALRHQAELHFLRMVGIHGVDPFPPKRLSSWRCLFSLPPCEPSPSLLTLHFFFSVSQLQAKWLGCPQCCSLSRRLGTRTSSSKPQTFPKRSLNFENFTLNCFLLLSLATLPAFSRGSLILFTGIITCLAGNLTLG